LALPQIAEHKAALLASKLHVETSWRRQYEPGLHDGPNGERIAATHAVGHPIADFRVRSRAAQWHGVLVNRTLAA
jgi:hypothetical protein